MSKTDEPAEGAILLPKRAPLWGGLTLVGFLLAQVAGASVYVAKVDARLEGFAESDARITKRSDERYATINDRLGSLERDRNDISGRLIRLEEQSKVQVELLREIRETMRAPRR